MTRSLFALAAGLAVLAAVPTRATADVGSGGLAGGGPAKPANRDVQIEPRVGEFVPLDAEFRDEEDRPTTLRACIGGKVTILVPMYYRCPKLCNIVLEELVDTLRKMPSDYGVGKEFNVVCLSFDPKERNSRVGLKRLAAEKKEHTVAVYGRPGAEAGWHFLTGEAGPIKSCMESLGYKYEYDRFLREYNHPSGLVVLTPSGRISRYFYGIDFGGQKRLADASAEVDPKDLLPGEVIPRGMTTLRLSLVEASEGKLGSFLDQVTLACSSYEYGKGYSVKRAVQIGGLLTLLCVGSWIGFSLRRERRRAADTATAGTQNRPHDGPPPGGTT